MIKSLLTSLFKGRDPYPWRKSTPLWERVRVRAYDDATLAGHLEFFCELLRHHPLCARGLGGSIVSV
jgi:hypothetical protein